MKIKLIKNRNNNKLIESINVLSVHSNTLIQYIDWNFDVQWIFDVLRFLFAIRAWGWHRWRRPATQICFVGSAIYGAHQLQEALQQGFLRPKRNIPTILCIWGDKLVAADQVRHATCKIRQACLRPSKSTAAMNSVIRFIMVRFIHFFTHIYWEIRRPITCNK